MEIIASPGTWVIIAWNSPLWKWSSLHYRISSPGESGEWAPVSLSWGCIKSPCGNQLLCSLIKMYNFLKMTFNTGAPLWVDNASSRRHRLLNENPSVRHGIPRCELLVKGVPEAHRTTQSVVIALGHPPELRGKNLLCKIQHTSVARHGEIKLSLTWKSPKNKQKQNKTIGSYHIVWLERKATNGTWHKTMATRSVNKIIPAENVHAMILTCQARFACWSRKWHRYYGDTCFLTGFEAFGTGGNLYLVL